MEAKRHAATKVRTSYKNRKILRGRLSNGKGLGVPERPHFLPSQMSVTRETFESLRRKSGMPLGSRLRVRAPPSHSGVRRANHTASLWGRGDDGSEGLNPQRSAPPGPVRPSPPTHPILRSPLTRWGPLPPAWAPGTTSGQV